MARRSRIRTCPNCGEEFAVTRPACPECGSDENTGWRDEEDIAYEAVEIPDFLPPDDELVQKHGTATVWRLVAAFVLLVFLLVFVFGW